jgi:2'-5' RNA ligase
VWPVEGFAAAAKAVEAATAAIGQPVPDRRFLGHLTIARGRPGMDLRAQRHLLAPLDMSWAVTSLSLVRSDLHPNGARYSDVATFPTGGGGG